MYKKTIEALVNALNSEIPIYINEVKQNLQLPCFKILTLNLEKKRQLGNRYKLIQNFDILYYPESDNDCTLECISILENLNEALEYIVIDKDYIRGFNMHGEIINDVLHFFVDYNIFMLKIDKPKYMKKLEIKGEIKND